jgi:dTMP kinase
LSLFITFEGGEGCGKSTQAKALFRNITSSKVPVILTQEPGGTPLGREVRQWLKGEMDSDPIAELLLFNASRVQLINNVIRPALKEGKVVLCDRFYHSTIAYQGYGRGLDLGLIDTINNIATSGLDPDLIIFLDTDVEQALSRKRNKDRFEQEDIAFHQRVKQGYLEMSKADPKLWMVIDGSLSKSAIEKIIWDKVVGLLPKR